MSSHRSGFTIIEVIVVVSIIGILLAVVIVGVGSYQSRAKKADATAAAEQVKLKLSTYFQSRNRYPVTQTDVVNYLNSVGATDLGTKFTSTTNYSYAATMADGSTCTLTGVSTCDKYTITVKKAAWNGNSSDSDVTITP